MSRAHPRIEYRPAIFKVKKGSMQKLLFLVVVSTALILGQPTVSPTPQQAGTARGDNVGDYNITTSFETGYRFYTVDGNGGMYRSNVNLRNGIRLLGGSVTMNSKDGKGRYFDEINLTLQGLGSDPYQSVFLRMQKNRIYRYDFLWRTSDYFNPALSVSNGRHFLDTTRQLQDHDVTLFPQSKYRLFFGYSRNLQEGPGLSTVQYFDSRGDEFTLFANIHRLRNEYRMGAQAEFFGFGLNVLHGWENYSEVQTELLNSPSPGANPNDRVSLNSLQRIAPYQGSTPYWRASLIRNVGKIFQANGHFTYSNGQRDFTLAETADGISRNGAAANRQITLSGTGNRPASTGNVTLSLLPSDTLTITNHTSIYNIRISGDSTYREFNGGIANLALLSFQYLGIQTWSNQSDVSYRISKWIAAYGGYQHSDRRIRSIQYRDLERAKGLVPDEQTNKLDAGLFGLRFQPAKRFRFSIDSEVGRTDHPIYPISEKNYHSISGRAQWKTNRLTVASSYKTNYNFNSNALTAFSSRGRNASLNAVVAPTSWFNLDAGYSKIHLDTLSGLAYFQSGQLVTGNRSAYLSNIHAINISARLTLKKRVDIFGGFNRVQDVGDDRPSSGTSIPNTLINQIDSAAFATFQTFPLRFSSPQARISVRLRQKLRANFGYQYYGYNEKWITLQDYNAHTGYVSLTWAF